MSADYEVGYGKPPRHGQFHKGRSGNPKGRPKGTKNLKTDLQEELAEQILIREGSREKHISKQRAMVKSLMAHAVKGDARTANLVLQMVYRLLEVNAPGEDADLSTDERAILDDFAARVLQKAQQKARGRTDGNPPKIPRKRLRLRQEHD